VVHGIVQSHHGAIFVRSTPGTGSCFEVFLPALVELAVETGPLAEEQIAPGRQERLLLVDDDGIALAALRGQLEHIGYRVTAVSDPRVALRLFLTQPAGYDLVLTDNAMPGLSGPELSEKILAARPDIPVVLISGFFDPKHLDEARALGICELVRKPVPLPELARIIARHLHRPARD
jgi:two-component system, cell cycle sensor histidine kinase and response regulator CckA